MYLDGDEWVVQMHLLSTHVSYFLMFHDAGRALFRRTGLLVAPHGAALTNMVFMPLNSSVLEIRPREMIAGCYRQLASVCSLNYFLSLGEGNKSTSLRMNVYDVMRKLNHIKLGLNLD